jgi:hypothetical protein
VLPRAPYKVHVSIAAGGPVMKGLTVLTATDRL